MSRHAARERALQTLFQMDINKVAEEQAVEYTQNMVGSMEHDAPYYRSLLQGVLAAQEYIDRLIHQYSEDWQLNRMPGVDRNILRIGAYELLYETDIPSAVVLDEAIELSKEYGTDRSAKFINGVLAGFLRDLDDLRQGAPKKS